MIRKWRVLLSLLLLAAPAVVQGQSGDGYGYSTNAANTNTITVTNYTGPGGVVSIPTNINGLTVTGIGNGEASVFEDTGVTSISIPNSVTDIETNAFLNCDNLTNVTIGNGVTTIGEFAFYSCTSLTNVTVGSGLTNLEEDAFGDCTSLTNITFDGNAPTNADPTAFGVGQGPDDDTHAVVYYYSGTTGWSNTFAGVPAVRLNQPAPTGSLQVTILPSSITTLAIGAAQWQVDSGPLQSSGAVVSGLTEGNHVVSFTPVNEWITPPNQIVNIGPNATNTDTGVYTEEVQFAFIYITNANDTLTITGYTGAGGAVTIPNTINGLTVTSIGTNAFFDSTNITSVTISGNITNIGSFAFEGCSNLVSVVVPASLAAFGEDVFENCTNLANLYFEGNAPSADTTLFAGDPTNSMTAYILSGATGWSSKYEGVPTAVWVQITLTLTAPANGLSYTAPANITLIASVTNGSTNTVVNFYSNGIAIGPSQTASPSYSYVLTSVAAGTYAFYATATNTNGILATSAVSYVTVNNPGTTWIDFDPLAASAGPVENATLATYLSQYGVSVVSESPGTAVAVENQANVAGGDAVIASTQPNLLTQIGSNGPVSFTVGFSNLLAQFSFTRPELVANPFVTHPAWQVQAFDSLGVLLAATNAPQIFSYTNVPAQTYTLSSADGIASVVFSSEGTGLTTFNAMLLDDFILTPAISSNLPPSVVITSPTNGELFVSATNPTSVPITFEVEPSATVTNVSFYAGTNLIASAPSNVFSTFLPAPASGVYTLTAVAVNSNGLSRTSAPVTITVAAGFAIETPPQSQTIGVGGNATFSITTTGTNVTYQWQLDGTNIAGATNASYAVTNAALGATGSYTVVAVSGGQTISNNPPAVLNVLGPPTIGSFLITTNTTFTSTNIVLSLIANDTVPYYYQWQLNGNGIAGVTSNNLTGSTLITYTITNAQPFDSGNYQVVVANVVASVESPGFLVSLTFGAPVTTNVNFASSLNLGLLTNGVGVSGINSTNPPSAGPALIAGKPAAGFLWYNWTAPFTGVVSLTTRGSSFDTLLGVYTGSAPGSLTSVAEDDDDGGYFTSLATFNCEQGTNYQIVVAGYQGATGNVVLALSPGPTFLPGPVGGYSVGVTNPLITQQPVSQIVPAGGIASLSVTATNATSYQWYFAGIPVAGATTNTLVINNFLAGTAGNYNVQVSNAVGGLFSSLAAVQIATENNNGTMSTPTNLLVDKFGDAADLIGSEVPDHFRPEGGGDSAGFSLSQTFSTVGATKEVGEPEHAGQPGGASYWYAFVATGVGAIQFDTMGSAFNTILAVYTNIGPTPNFSTLTNVGSDYTTNYVQDGQPVVTLSNLVAGTKYYIAVDGYMGASGDAVLNVAFTPPPVSTNIIPIINSQTVVAFTSPASNYVSLVSSITLRGTIKGHAGMPPQTTFLRVTVNTNAPIVISNFTAIPPATLGWTIPGVTLLPGANFITAQSFDMESSNLQSASLPVTRTLFYDTTPPSTAIKSILTLLVSGDGKITGEHNLTNLEVGKIFRVNAVPMGNWVFAGWAAGTNTNSLTALPSGPSLAFDMEPGLILQATFVPNPFTAVAGVYNGLFAPAEGATEQTSGFLTATLPPGGHGAYSAKLLLDGGSNSFSGTFDLTGDAQQTIFRAGKPPLEVVLHVNLNLPEPDEQLTGSVINYEVNGWTSPLQAYAAVFNANTNPATNYAGQYTMIIPPGSNAPALSPGGYGYATLNASLGGKVVISGRLADNAAISQSVPVSAAGYIPLYVPLYGGKGSLQGWLTMANLSPQTLLGPDLSWFKVSGAAGTPYAAGFTNTNITVLGSLYVPTQPGGDNFLLTNGTLTISNGSPATALTISNLSVQGNALVNNNTGNTVGVIAAKTGILTVTFKLPGASANTVAKGVVLQNTVSTNGAGWFINTGKSGYFLLQE